MLTRRLPVKLHDEDVLDRGQKLAQAEYDYAAIEYEKDKANKEFKKQLDEHQGLITGLARVIKERVEIQDVQVVTQDDTLAMLHRVIRVDTGETVESYSFSESEIQKALFQ